VLYKSTISSVPSENHQMVMGRDSCSTITSGNRIWNNENMASWAVLNGISTKIATVYEWLHLFKIGHASLIECIEYSS